jgi:hypothetical protein
VRQLGGFVIENLIAAAPERTMPSFYCTAAGAEIDLVLEIPGYGRWAFEIKRSQSAKPEKGFLSGRARSEAGSPIPGEFRR